MTDLEPYDRVRDAELEADLRAGRVLAPFQIENGPAVSDVHVAIGIAKTRAKTQGRAVKIYVTHACVFEVHPPLDWRK